ncbi:hypothetical protein QE152_g5117 [Popillia japonica]|uniref:Uncharacterized protein n=1 Tax=Popillia japonica TaxID=7064 RepID=A0AAW1N0C7_POPJA
MQIVRALFPAKNGTPNIWKTKLADSPSAFRPICLLNIMGKLYEHLIKNRLEEEIHREDGATKDGEIDTAEHAALVCRRWSDERSALEKEMDGKLAAGNIVKIMLENEDNWQKITNEKEMDGKLAAGNIVKIMLENEDNWQKITNLLPERN